MALYSRYEIPGPNVLGILPSLSSSSAALLGAGAWEERPQQVAMWDLHTLRLRTLVLCSLLLIFGLVPHAKQHRKCDWKQGHASPRWLIRVSGSGFKG